jgi:hypothetical protein
MRIGESFEATKSEADLFQVYPTQTTVQEGFYDDIPAHNSFNTSSTIRFDVTGDSDHYLNLQEFTFHIIGTITKPDNTAVTNNSKTSVVNNLLGSLFKQVEISFNNHTIENTNSTFSYIDYVVKTLGLSSQEKISQLSGNLYHKDDPERFNTCIVTGNDQKNTGFIKRREKILEKASIELQGKLSCDAFNINHLLVPSVSVQVKLTKSEPKFYMLGDDADGFFFNYTDVFLRIKRHVISPSVMEAHLLTSQITPFKYPLRRVSVKYSVIPHASTKFVLTEVCKGIMPRRVIVGFVKTTAFDGSLKENPYEFKNIGIRNLKLKINSKSLPVTSGLNLDFAKGLILDGYKSLSKLSDELDITPQEYKNGYTLFSFDLNPDIGSSYHYSLLKDGQMDLEVVMETALADSHTALFFCEFDNVIEIDNKRQINFDFNI